MGIVYRAWQPSAEREVALKCLTLNDEAAQARFSTEIRALGRVEHPNLVRVYTSGMDGDRVFYAMELIEGTGFRSLLRHLPETAGLDDVTWREAARKAAAESKLSAAEMPSVSSNALNLAAKTSDEVVGFPERLTKAHESDEYVRRMIMMIRDIASAIQALHDKGVIHRDIKPDNMMLTDDGQRAVLMDLGIAKLTASDDSGITRTRQFVGSIRYASPEQLIDSGQVDHRTDIYSLGATLWELLTLRPIYGISADVHDSQAMLKIEIEEPDPVRKFNSAVPADLQAIIQKCLEKGAERRYETATKLSDDLERWLFGQPVKARPVTALTRCARRLRRKPIVPALLLTVVLLGVALSAAIWPIPTTASRDMRIGIKPWVGFCPLVVASEMNLCEAADLILVPVRTAADVRRKIVAGELDVSPYLVDSHALAQAERTPTKVILQLDVSLTADAVVACQGIDSFSDLKGHRVAYMHHEAPHFLLLSLCEKYQLNPDDFVHVKTDTVQEAVNCFVAGEADAVVCYEPFVQTALSRKDAFRLASAADDPGAIIDVLTVRDDYVDNNPERVKALIEAWMKGLELLEQGDPQALNIACQFLGTDDRPLTPKEYYEMAEGMRYGDRAENLRFFQTKANGKSEFHERMQSAQQRWDRHHQISRMTDPRQGDRSDLLFQLYSSSVGQ